MNRPLICPLLIFCLLSSGCSEEPEGSGQVGTESRPLRVVLVPSELGATSVLDDFEPLFTAIQRHHGLHFDVRLGQSYAAVVEALVNEQADLAWLGPVTFCQARRRGRVELLAVSVEDGASSYNSGIFVDRDSGLEAMVDLASRSLALGDVNSTSSFHVPVAMLLAAGIDPVNDLSAFYITGSHSNSLTALREGRVDAAAAAFNAYSKSVNAGVLDPLQYVALAKSDPIPNPPIAMHGGLPTAVKQRLREAFRTLHTTDGVNPHMLLGYGGVQVDRYDTEFPVATFDAFMNKLAMVTDELKAEMISKAGNR